MLLQAIHCFPNNVNSLVPMPMISIFFFKFRNVFNYMLYYNRPMLMLSVFLHFFFGFCIFQCLRFLQVFSGIIFLLVIESSVVVLYRMKLQRRESLKPGTKLTGKKSGKKIITGPGTLHRKMFIHCGGVTKHQKYILLFQSPTK